MAERHTGRLNVRGDSLNRGVTAGSTDDIGTQDLLLSEPIVALLHKTVFHERLWPVAAVAFGLYYCGSAVAAWLSGTLCSWQMIRSGSDTLDLNWLLQRILVIPPRNADFVPLLSDFAHLNFSVLVCLIGCPLGYKFLCTIPQELRRYELGTQPHDPGAFSQLLRRLRNAVANKKLNLLAPAFFGLLSGCTFVLLARSGNDDASRWWGNARLGFAGYYLAAVQAVICYYALWFLRMLQILHGNLSTFLERVTEFRPFHPDGYYGFQPLARLLLWEAVLFLCAGIALFSTYSMGYFGLERKLLVLICLVIFTVATGTILAWFAWVLTARVRKLRSDAIATIEPRMQNLLRRSAPEHESTSSNSDIRDELTVLMRLHETLRMSKTLPFGLASLNAVLVTYGVQAAILVRQFYARFHYH